MPSEFVPSARNAQPLGAGPEFFQHAIDGRQLRIARWRASGGSSAAPLLFFTGIGANIELLAPFLEHLGNRDIITFDVPGVGASPAMSRPYRLRTIARLADCLLDDLGYGRVDVMGLSWGGMLAQQFAHQYAGRVERLVLGATSAGSTMIPGSPSALVKMLMPKRYHQPQFLKRHFRTIYGGSQAGAEDFGAQIKAPGGRGYMHQMLAVAGWSSLPFLGAIKAPTLIVMGSEDRLVPPANGYVLKVLMRDARLEVIAGAGHLFALTHRQQTAQLVKSFLREAQPARLPAPGRQMKPLPAA